MLIKKIFCGYSLNKEYLMKILQVFVFYGLQSKQRRCKLQSAPPSRSTTFRVPRRHRAKKKRKKKNFRLQLACRKLNKTTCASQHVPESRTESRDQRGTSRWSGPTPAGIDPFGDHLPVRDYIPSRCIGHMPDLFGPY